MQLNDITLPKGSYLICGIDTDAGKTVTTGLLARHLAAQGQHVITHKPIQTGCNGIAEDIATHRQIMGCGLLPEDEAGLTMPQIFSYPCSPHLATRLDARAIDFAAIDASIRRLQGDFDTVLIEGAGGLMVPWTDDLLQIDWFEQTALPLVLVSGGKLGSINHTLLSIEALNRRGMKLHALAYNHFFAGKDALINEDSRDYLQQAVARLCPAAEFWDIPIWDGAGAV